MTLQEKACGGKKSFPAFAEARRAMRYVLRANPDNDHRRMSVYRCRYCQSYHFGHDVKAPPRKRALQ